MVGVVIYDPNKGREYRQMPQSIPAPVGLQKGEPAFIEWRDGAPRFIIMEFNWSDGYDSLRDVTPR